MTSATESRSKTFNANNKIVKERIWITVKLTIQNRGAESCSPVLQVVKEMVDLIISRDRIVDVPVAITTPNTNNPDNSKTDGGSTNTVP